jgi:hypothetical protein
MTVADLAAVERRRDYPTRLTQKIQVFLQNRVIGPVLSGTTEPTPPFALKLLSWFPVLRRIPARLIGMGVRPEHVRTPEVSAAS